MSRLRLWNNHKLLFDRGFALEIEALKFITICVIYILKSSFSEVITDFSLLYSEHFTFSPLGNVFTYSLTRRTQRCRVRPKSLEQDRRYTWLDATYLTKTPPKPRRGGCSSGLVQVLRGVRIRPPVKTAEPPVVGLRWRGLANIPSPAPQTL